MRLPVTRDLYDYWGRLKGERAAPDRAEIDPVAIRHILPDIFIIEVDPERRLPLRLCGARVNALWQREQKGRLFLEWWRAQRQEEVAEAIRGVIDAQTPLVAQARTALGASEFELLLLPLRHFSKSCSRVLGSLAPAQRLDWVGIRPVGRLDLVAARMLEDKLTDGSKEDWRRGAIARRAASNG
ncbi:PAS domain-containing protein [Methylocystis sp. FS]|uniref:PAS domain-containing protein n=1 Tax=Methylocystis silviterrae TaxID=2743612 RepID=UPI001583EA98|nr:PAS domain-containing protein [Methylocystis silviterrae]NUJ79136.1 PAS domain-containing protein [Methylocystis silviterrae]